MTDEYSEDPMTFRQFQEQANPVKPVDYEDLGSSGLTLYWSNAVGGESGEFQNIVKKIVRDGTDALLLEHMVEEAGDTLFYLKMTLERYGFELEDAAAYCLVKLDNLRRQQQNG